MSKFVVSTMSGDVEYTAYARKQEGKDLRNIPVKSVCIKGGQGVMKRRELITPYNGVVTEVSDSDIEMLRSNPIFKRHEQRGFVRIVDFESERKVAPMVQNEMTAEDDSAQLTPEDFANEAEIAESNGDELKIGGKKVSSKGRKRSNKRNK